MYPVTVCCRERTGYQLFQNHTIVHLAPRSSNHLEFTDVYIVTKGKPEPTRDLNKPMKQPKPRLFSLLTIWATVQLAGASLQDTASDAEFCSAQADTQSVRYSSAALECNFRVQFQCMLSLIECLALLVCRETV